MNVIVVEIIDCQILFLKHKWPSDVYDWLWRGA